MRFILINAFFFALIALTLFVGAAQAETLIIGYNPAENPIPSVSINNSLIANTSVYKATFKNNSNLPYHFRYDSANGYYLEFDVGVSQMQWYRSSIGAVGGGTLNPQNNNVTFLDNTVTYPNAWPNTNITYTLTKDTVKEDIVIGSIPANTSNMDFARFKTNIKYNNTLRTCLNYANGSTECFAHPSNVNRNTTQSIYFLDPNNNTAYTIPKPYVVDKNGTVFNATFFLTMNNGVDSWYMGLHITDIQKMQFPIRFDPTVSQSGNICLWIETNDAAIGLTSRSDLDVSEAVDETRIYCGANFTIPLGSNIVAANWSLKSRTNDTATTISAFHSYRNMSGWGSMNWTTQYCGTADPINDGAVCNVTAFNVTTGYVGQADLLIDAAQWVRNCLPRGQTNCTMMLDSSSGRSVFQSSNPTLQIEYTPANTDTPPVITITYPTNSTFIQPNILFNFSFTDENTTANCSRSLDAGGWFGLGVINNNTANVTIVNNLSAATHNLTVQCISGGSGVTSASAAGNATVWFTILHYNRTSLTYKTTELETNDTLIYFTYNVSSNILDVNATLFYNNTPYNLTKNTTSGQYNFTANVTVPLIVTNNTALSFYFEAYIYYNNGTIVILNNTGNTQTIRYAYEPMTSTSNKATYGELEYLNVTGWMFKYLDRATLLVNITFNNTLLNVTLNTNTTNETTFLAPGQTSLISGSIQSFAMNATWFISFGGLNRTVSAANGFLNVSKINLSDCSAGGQQVLNITIYNETARTTFVNGNINALFTIYKLNTVFSNNFTFSLANTFSYVICLSPANESVIANASLEYVMINATTNTQRNYFLVNFNLSTPVQYINLYLLDPTLTRITEITVLDQAANPLPNAIIKIQRQYVENNSFITVAMARTDFDGVGITRLAPNDVWYKFIVEQNGQVLQEFQATKVVPDAITNIASFSLRLTGSAGLIYTYLGSIASNCAYASATDRITCTATDVTGSIFSTHLKVDKFGIVNWTVVCDASSDYSNGVTQTCTLGSNSTQNQTYRYVFTGLTSKGSTVLAQDFVRIGTATAVYGTMGLFVALMIITMFALMGANNPTVSLAFMGVGILISFLSGTLVLQVSSIVSIIVVLAVIGHKMKT